MVMRAPGRDRGQPDRPPRHLRRGVLCLDLPLARSYSTGLRTVTDCRFWELPAEDFGWAVREWFPMATHMLEGFAVQGMGSQQTVSTRERLVALGTVTAGLTHELNNPATPPGPPPPCPSAWPASGRSWPGWPGGLDADGLAALAGLVRQASDGRAGQAPLSPLEASDREDELGGWLEEHGVARAWDLAPPLVAAGVDTAGWSGSPPPSPPRCCPMPVGCRGHDLRCREPAGGGGRGVRTHRRSSARPSSTARWTAALRQVDVHDGLESTLTMLKHKLETGIEVVRD